jgi:predicted RNase H-like HicB family nuclease
MKYRVRLERTDEGYAVWCPGLPGCWSQGATEEEALDNIRDAIETYVATVEELPSPPHDAGGSTLPWPGAMSFARARARPSCLRSSDR